jgi:hypothetical protein
MLTTTPVSRPASWANKSANGVSGSGAWVGAAAVSADWVGAGAGCGWVWLDAAAASGRWAGSGAAGGGVGPGGGVAIGAAGGLGGWASPDAPIIANNANEAAATALRRRKTLTPVLPRGECSAERKGALPAIG